MKKFNLKKFNKGIGSLTEVLIASIIFIIAVFGILSSMTMIAPQAEESSDRLKAAYAGKHVLDQLRSQIDADSWNDTSGELSVGTHNRCVDGHFVEWTVTEIGTDGLLRRLEVSVEPNDPSC